jgi:hypothetical protein
MNDQASRPRCPERGCPIRYRGGPDRACPEHQDEPDWSRMAWTTLMDAPAPVAGQARNALAAETPTPV